MFYLYIIQCFKRISFNETGEPTFTKVCCAVLWECEALLFLFVFGVKCVYIIHVALEFLLTVCSGCVALREQKEWWCCRKSVQRHWTPITSPAPYLGFFPFKKCFIGDDPPPPQKTKQGLICCQISCFTTAEIRHSYIMLINTSIPLKEAIQHYKKNP